MPPPSLSKRPPAGAGGPPLRAFERRTQAIDTETLVERCREGDPLAWETLVRRYQGRVYSIAFHYLRDREEARDAAQAIFVKIYRGFSTLEDAATFLPWMIRLARNCCVDRLRRDRARRAAASVPLEEALEVRSELPDPEARSSGRSRQRLIQRALDQIGAANRELILLKEIQGLRIEEIATLLEEPVGTVKSRSHRARLQLARAIRALDPSFGAVE